VPTYEAGSAGYENLQRNCFAVRNIASSYETRSLDVLRSRRSSGSYRGPEVVCEPPWMSHPSTRAARPLSNPRRQPSRDKFLLSSVPMAFLS